MLRVAEPSRSVPLMSVFRFPPSTSMIYQEGEGNRHRSQEVRPECLSRQSLLLGVCDVCLADFGEWDGSGPILFVDRLFWDLDPVEPGFSEDDHSE